MSDGRESEGIESRIRKLEEIVDRLEQGDLELQEALDLFEEGVAQVREAHTLMERTRLRVEKLVRELDGTVSLESEPDEA